MHHISSFTLNAFKSQLKFILCVIYMHGDWILWWIICVYLHIWYWIFSLCFHDVNILIPTSWTWPLVWVLGEQSCVREWHRFFVDQIDHTLVEPSCRTKLMLGSSYFIRHMCLIVKVGAQKQGQEVNTAHV
jgi:hypothetical protein